MKRQENPDDLPTDLNPESKKPQLSRSVSTTNKLLKVIPIKDAYIAKILSKNPDKFLNHFSELAESLSVKHRLKIDQYSTALELSVENPENNNIEVLHEEFSNILENLKKNLNETKIPCSLEEYHSLLKYIEKGHIVIEGDIHYINELNSKPLILKEFIVNEGFSMEIVLVEDFQTMSLETSDNLVINFTKNGVFLDEFMQKQKICKKITQFFKKNQNFYVKDEIMEANLPEFKVFLQIFDSQEILEEGFLLKMTRKYIRQLLDRILFNKQYINLYYPVTIAREKEIIKIFLEEIMEISRNYPEDANFLMFPSKISFLCIEKQKEILLEIFEKFKAIGSLEELPSELKQGGRWSLTIDNGYNNINRAGGLFMNPFNNNVGQNRGKTLDSKASKIIERAYILGEKQGFVLIDERKIQDHLQQNQNPNYYGKKSLSGKRSSNKNQWNNDNNNGNDKNFMNEDEITIDFKKMAEISKLTGYEKLIIFDDSTKEFQYLDEISSGFISYDQKINKVLTFLKKILVKKLIYHVDFETMLPIEKIYSFDLTNFTLKPFDENVRSQNNNNVNNNFNNNNLFQFGGLQNPQILNIARTKDKKLNPFLNKTLKLLKNKGVSIRITDASALEIEKPSNKTPQLIIRTIENEGPIVQTIKELLLKKQIAHFMKMRQNSRLLQKSLEDLCLRNNIQWDLNEKVLRIRGNRKTINNMRLEIQKLDEMDLEDAIIPENWDPQVENLKEVDLSPQSLEFADVSKAFKITCSQYEIFKVIRIQNKKLWENYIFEKKRLKFKGDCTEKMLFHGTRNNDPIKIYSGIEEGFDVRLANHGAVGKGIYFAEMASYSVGGFAHQRAKGNFVIIYANVLVGASYASMGGNYIMPPYMPNDSNKRFDSVRAGTNYTVYNSNRAYPAYVIEYKGNNNLGRMMAPLGNLNMLGNNYNVFNNNVVAVDDDEDDSNYYEEDDEEEA